MALALFLEVIDSPKVLILLQEVEKPTSEGAAGQELEIKVDAKAEKVEVKRRSAQTSSAALPPVTENTENALAKCFHDAGYTVLTSRDILTGDAKADQEAHLAKQGYTELARKFGVLHGADVVLCGPIQIVGTPISLVGRPFKMVSVTSTIRAVVTGSGQTLAIEKSQVKRSSEIYEAAKDTSLSALVKDIGEKLVWKIPEVLANNPKITTVSLAQCTIDEMKAVAALLSATKGVESLRTGAWSRQGDDTGKVVFTVSSGFLGASADDLYEVLKSSGTLKFKVEGLSKYNLQLSVNHPAP